MADEHHEGDNFKLPDTRCLVCGEEVVVLAYEYTVTPDAGEPLTGYLCRGCASPTNARGRLAVMYRAASELRRRAALRPETKLSRDG